MHIMMKTNIVVMIGAKEGERPIIQHKGWKNSGVSEYNDRWEVYDNLIHIELRYGLYGCACLVVWVGDYGELLCGVVVGDIYCWW